MTCEKFEDFIDQVTTSAVGGANVQVTSNIQPTSNSEYPVYNLLLYKAWKCQGNITCINQFPALPTLTWAPASPSSIYENTFWRWTDNTNPSRYIRCAQDYYPVGPSYSYCTQYHPDIPGWSPSTASRCYPNTWFGTPCAQGAKINNLPCCTGNGPAVDWY